MNKKELLNKLKNLWAQKGDFYGWCVKHFPKTPKDITLINDYFIKIYKMVEALDLENYELKNFYNLWNSKIKGNFMANYYEKSNSNKAKSSNFPLEYDSNEVASLDNQFTHAEKLSHNPQRDYSHLNPELIDIIIAEIYEPKMRQIALKIWEGYTWKQIQEQWLKTTRDDFQDHRQRLLHKLAKYQIEHKWDLEGSVFAGLKLLKDEIKRQRKNNE